MLECHDELTLTVLEDEELRKKHMDYKYLIHQKWGSFKAFHTEEGLNYWLKITGLKIGEKIGHLYNTSHIIGKFFTHSILGIEDWIITEKESSIRKELLDGSKSDLDLNCVWLSNGDYTKGFIEKSEEGNTIYYLNPNEHNRIKYHYFAVKN